MNPTLLLFAMLAVVVVASLLASALLLQLGSRWAKIPGVGFGRALFVMFLITVAGLVVRGWAVSIREPISISKAVFILALIFMFGPVLSWAIIARLFHARTLRAIQAWLPTLLVDVVGGLLALLVFRPYCFEAFYIPTNSMAPTLIGRHLAAPCPRCGSPAFGSAPLDHRPLQNPELMICSRELRCCEVQDPPLDELPGDRFLVCKMIQPRRWDVIAFHLPEDPHTTYCKRLVGLPGETVVIRDGTVWIDGKKQEMPEALRGLEYVTKMEGWFGPVWGSEEYPAKLGADEYFVLGDFSRQAKDSRLWDRGAPGHPPYAVPGSHIIGVATHIYWPYSRWRVLR
jgi:signal peptidase I